MEGTEFDAHDNSIINVIETDEDHAVQPRSYNDTRYFKVEDNLSNIVFDEDFLKAFLNDDFMTAIEKKLFDKQYPIGHVLINANDSRNPETYLSFGKWDKYAQGRVILGEGSTIDSRNETMSFAAASEGGEFKHVLTIDELPAHDHDMKQFNENIEKRDNYSRKRVTNQGSNTDLATTNKRGGDKPHNNVQPYITAYIWKRIS